MTYWMIRRKRDLAFFPQLRFGCGATYHDPTLKGVPRLFTREQDAKAALRCWLAGQYVRQQWEDWETGYKEYSIKIKPVRGRNAKDFEIIKVTLEQIP